MPDDITPRTARRRPGDTEGRTGDTRIMGHRHPGDPADTTPGGPHPVDPGRHHPVHGGHHAAGRHPGHRRAATWPSGARRRRRGRTVADRRLAGLAQRTLDHRAGRGGRPRRGRRHRAGGHVGRQRPRRLLTGAPRTSRDRPTTAAARPGCVRSPGCAPSGGAGAAAPRPGGEGGQLPRRPAPVGHRPGRHRLRRARGRRHHALRGGVPVPEPDPDRAHPLGPGRRPADPGPAEQAHPGPRRGDQPRAVDCCRQRQPERLRPPHPRSGHSESAGPLGALRHLHLGRRRAGVSTPGDTTPPAPLFTYSTTAPSGTPITSVHIPFTGHQQHVVDVERVERAAGCCPTAAGPRNRGRTAADRDDEHRRPDRARHVRPVAREQRGRPRSAVADDRERTASRCCATASPSPGRGSVRRWTTPPR